MIDSHCHLADKAFESDLEDVLARARTADVSPFICIADSLPEAERCILLAERYKDVYATVGVHPHNAKDWASESDERMRELLSSSLKVRAIGEIGLDYHYDFSPRETQRTVFETQLQMAAALHLPVVVHCREAVDDLWHIVREFDLEKLVIHCCSERWSDVERFVAKGYLLSFTGIATYPNASDIRDTIAQCPLSQLMIETDAPYLAPVPYRGKRNEPAYVVEVASMISAIKGVPVEEIASVTAKNAIEFFGLES